MTINREESIDLREREREKHKHSDRRKDGNHNLRRGGSWLDFKSGLLRRLVALQSERVMT